MDYNNSLDLEDSDSNDKTVLGMAPLKEQERFLPIANIAKIMKKAIPSDNGKVKIIRETSIVDIHAKA